MFVCARGQVFAHPNPPPVSSAWEPEHRRSVMQNIPVMSFNLYHKKLNSRGN